jgi:hypothetical protein
VSSRFKQNYASGWDIRRLAGFGIASDAGTFVPHVKGAKAAKDDRVTVSQSGFDLLQDRLDDFLCLELRQIRLIRNPAYNLGFPHPYTSFSSLTRLIRHLSTHSNQTI